MLRTVFTFILFLFAVNIFSQEITFDSNRFVGSKSVIRALNYTNAINKYYFDTDSMDDLAVFLLANVGVYIEVNCYTDFKEGPLISLMATTEQAEDIRNYLVQKGIAGSRIKTIGNGDMFPIVKEAVWLKMDDEEKKIANNMNRRIEIVIIKKGS